MNNSWKERFKDPEYEVESFLEWCIDHSFEIDEETKIALNRLEKLKARQSFQDYKWNPETMIKWYKVYVELNLLVRLARYAIVWVIVYFLTKACSN